VRSLAGKVTLVTGAARDRGIGRGIALVLAEHGCDVAVADVAYEDEGARRVAEIEALGRRAAFVKADFTDPAQANGAIGEVVARLGRLDVFCSNAGIATWEEVVDQQRETFERVFAVNLHGCFYGCRAAAAQMRRQGDGGAIVVTSSVHAVMPFPQMGVYGATKQAVGYLTGVMAREWARDRITVNHVGPGWVDTNINDESPDFQTDEARRATRAQIPFEHRAGDPREIGEAVAYLAESTYTSGAYLRVDGAFVVGKH